jgi:HSP20 family protein
VAGITKWNPYRELEEIQNRLSRVFGDVPWRVRDEDMFSADWAPALDIQETEKEYAVKVDLPEVKKEDIKVELLDGALTIQGERKQEKEEKGKKYHRVERQYGQFVRRFALPGEVDATKIQAQFKDGVLTVTMPKTAAATPKPVEVKVG